MNARRQLLNLVTGGSLPGIAELIKPIGDAVNDDANLTQLQWEFVVFRIGIFATQTEKWPEASLLIATYINTCRS